MPELRKVKFELCIPGVFRYAEYAIFGDNCVVCDARDNETPAVNRYLEEVIDAVNKQELLNRLGERGLQFYELQVRRHAHSFNYKTGHFVFMLVRDAGIGNDFPRFHWYHVKCPPVVVKTFLNIIGRPPVQVADEGWEIYDDHSRENKEKLLISRTDDFLGKTRTTIGHNIAKQVVVFGIPVEDTSELPGMIECEKRYKELLAYRPN